MKRAAGVFHAATRRSTRGAALLEQLVLVLVALGGLIGFSRFGTALHEQLTEEGQHIRGRGMPGSGLSPGALAGAYQPLPALGMSVPAVGGPTRASGSSPGGSSPGGSSPRGPASAPSSGSGSASASGPGSSSSSGSPSGSGSSSGAGSSPSSTSRPDLVCGESGTYKFDLGAGSDANDAPRAPSGSNLQRDHIPQKKSLQIRAEQLLAEEIAERVRKEMSDRCRHLTPTEEANIIEAVRKASLPAIKGSLSRMVADYGFAIVLPSPVHVNGLTYGRSSLAPTDAANLGAAAGRDMRHYLAILAAEEQAGNIDAECVARVRALLSARLASSISTEQYEQELMESVERQLENKAEALAGAIEKRFAKEDQCQ